MNSSTENNVNKTDAPCEFEQNMALLRDLPFFASMPVDSIKGLAYFSRQVRFKQGQDLFTQGDVDDKAYYLMDGEATLVRVTDSGEREVGTLGPERFLGALALLADVRRLFTLRAGQDLTCLVIPRKRVLSDMVSSPEFGKLFLKAIAQNIVQWEETLLRRDWALERGLEGLGASLV